MGTLLEKLKLLSDPTRHKIVEFLAAPGQHCCTSTDGICGCDIETFLDVSQPTVSHHMKLLVDAGLVRSERRGRWVYYELEPTALSELGGALIDLARRAEERAVAQATTAA